MERHVLGLIEESSTYGIWVAGQGTAKPLGERKRGRELEEDMAKTELKKRRRSHWSSENDETGNGTKRSRAEETPAQHTLLPLPCSARARDTDTHSSCSASRPRLVVRCGAEQREEKEPPWRPWHWEKATISCWAEKLQVKNKGRSSREERSTGDVKDEEGATKDKSRREGGEEPTKGKEHMSKEQRMKVLAGDALKNG